MYKVLVINPGSTSTKIAVYEGIIQLVHDLVVHRAAELRVRMQDDRDWRVLLARRMVATFEPAGRTRENDFRHGYDLEQPPNSGV